MRPIFFPDITSPEKKYKITKLSFNHHNKPGQMNIIRSIQNRIYEIRGERVMLDRDLAALYEVPTKSLNLSALAGVRRKKHAVVGVFFHRPHELRTIPLK
jgi:ORF6N domain